MSYTGDLVALSWETPNLILKGLAWLLSAALQVLGVARTLVRALEVDSEDLPEILPAIDDVSWQMIQQGPGGVDQIDGEELDDEKVVVCPTCLARKAIVL
jgi:hypothetical protein